MQGGDTMAMINAIWPFILMGGIFYFMLYRPQKQEQQKRQRMLDSLKKGDKVVTIAVKWISPASPTVILPLSVKKRLP